jgi:hypothetical protein
LAGVACGGEDITVAVPVSSSGEASVDLEEVEDAATEPPAAPEMPASTDIELLDDEPIEDPASCRLEVGGVAFFRAHRSGEFSVPPCIRAAVSSTLAIDNESGDAITVDLGETTRVIPPDGYDTFEDVSLGDLLGIGLHHLSDDLPDIWVVDPAESVFGDIEIMTLRSFGPLRTNFTVAEAEKVLGVDLVAVQENFGSCTFVTPAGPRDPYAPDLQVFGNDVDGRIVRIETHNPAVATPSGVRVGQPETMVTTTYGERVVSTPNEYLGAENPNYEYVPKDDADADYRLMFGTYDDTITSMWTATTEAAYLAEGCS